MVELLVSMGIFAVVITMCVSFFIAMQKMQSVYRDQANLQQEGRITSNIFSMQVSDAAVVYINDKNSDGSICSDADVNNRTQNNDFEDYIAIKKNVSDTEALVFACHEDNSSNTRYLMMGTLSVPVGTDLSPFTISSGNFGQLSWLSSNQVTIDDFQVANSSTTYPRTLKFNLKVKGSSGIAPEMQFPGYLVMNNEQ